MTKKKWGFRTFDGRLPIVKKHLRPHGEAPHYTSTIFEDEGDGKGAGDQVVVLDFGYGKKTDEELARRIVHDHNEIDDLAEALIPFVTHLSSEETTTITVPSAAIRLARERLSQLTPTR